MQQNNHIPDRHQQIIFKNTYYISISLCLIGFLTNSLLLHNIALATLAALAGVLLAGVYYLTNTKNLRLGIWLYLCITLISINFAWFQTNGITGSVPFMFIIFSIVVTTIALKNYLQFLSLILTNVLILVLIQYYYPQFIYLYQDITIQKLDITFFTFVTIILSNIAVIFFKMESNKKQNRLEQKNISLEASQIALKAAKEKAEKANRVKSDFLSAMSHEVRTPLNAIVGISNLLNQQTYDNEEKIKLVKALSVSTQELLTLLNGVLDFNQLEAGKMVITPSSVNLHNFLNKVHDFYVTKTQEKGIALHLHIASNVPTVVSVDGDKLRQVLDNLLSNAIKYTSKGSITISLKNQPKDSETSNLYFEIKDTGVGIPTDHHHHIFKEFTPLSISQKHTKGIGLGLNISARILKLMESEIQVENNPEGGTRFYFSLNCPVLEEAPKIENKDAKKELTKILLVEDNKTNVLVLTHFLKKWEISYEVAWDGLEALDQFRKQSFELILMDMQMPKMDGFEATEEIRKKNTTIPIIALTASATTHEKERAKTAGVNDYITKPFDPKQLLQIIKKHLIT